MRKFTLYLIPFILMPNVAYAYLDPGTGSIILQALVAGVISISVAFSSIRMKIWMFFQSLFKAKDQTNKDADN